MNSKILFLRHGQTDGNANKSYNGRTNDPLNAIGISQIEQIAPYVRSQMPLIVFSSPLQRCRDCCQIIFEGNTSAITFAEELMEIDFGIFEGKTYQELKKAYPEEVKMHQSDWLNYRIPNGESINDVYSRVSQYIQKTLNTYPGCNFLFIGHWGVIQSAISYLLHGSNKGLMKYELINGGVTSFSYVKNEFVLKELNREK